jgi:hypothetical protein
MLNKLKMKVPEDGLELLSLRAIAEADIEAQMVMASPMMSCELGRSRRQIHSAIKILEAEHHAEQNTPVQKEKQPYLELVETAIQTLKWVLKDGSPEDLEFRELLKQVETYRVGTLPLVLRKGTTPGP